MLTTCQLDGEACDVTGISGIKKCCEWGVTSCTLPLVFKRDIQAGEPYCNALKSKYAFNLFESPPKPILGYTT